MLVVPPHSTLTPLALIGVGDPVLGGAHAPEVAVAQVDVRGVADVTALRHLRRLPESASLSWYALSTR